MALTRVSRHSGESRNPGFKHGFKIWFTTWIPAFAGMTLCASLLISSPSYAQTPGAPDRVLRYAAGARDLALGQTMAALAEGPSATYWNPSLLSLTSHREAQLFHSQLFGGYSYSYLGYAHPFREAAGIGVQLLRYGVSNVDGRDANNLPTGSLSDNQIGLGVGGGITGILMPDLGLGATINLLHRDLAGRRSELYGLDLGANYRWLDRRLVGGLTLKNPLAFSTGRTEDTLPFHTGLGAAYQTIRGLWLAAEVEDGKELSVGLEYFLGRFLSLQVGKATNQMVSFGAGFAYRNAHIDFAFTDTTAGLGSTYATSVGFQFGVDRVQTRSKSGDLAFEQATELYRQGDWLKARRLLKRATVLDPSNQSCQVQFKRIAGALAALKVQKAADEELLKSKSNWAWLKGAMASTLDGADHMAQLYAAYAAMHDPQDFRLKDFLGYLEGASSATPLSSSEKGMTPEAFLTLKRQRVEEHFLKKEYGPAIEEGREILALEPQSAPDWERLGSLYYMIDEPSKTLEAYKTALELNPLNENLRNFVHTIEAERAAKETAPPTEEGTSHE